MQIALNISGTPLELAAALTALTGITPVEQIIAAPISVAPAPVEKTKTKAPAAKIVPLPTEKEATAAEDFEDDSALANSGATEKDDKAPAKKVKMPEGKIDVMMLRKLAAEKVQGEGKRDEFKALLTEFGTDHITKLSEHQFITFYTALSAL